MTGSPPFIIPIFIAHQGCPHQCVFCNQHAITKDSGQGAAVDAEMVHREIVRCLSRPRDTRRQVQVAFYGGSFTGLSREKQEKLLGAVRIFREQGHVHAIRVSTRPDYIDLDTAAFLKENKVGLVELGVQSMDQKVLDLAGRGHSREQVRAAFQILKQSGISVGGQLMIGLPGETTNGIIGGARELAALKPEMVRLYPTLVIHGSPLAQMYAEGKYQPLPLNRAIALCARLKHYFDQQNIRVIRMGLQPSRDLEKEMIAGPYHPAFGELVRSRIFFRTMRDILRARKKSGNGTLVTLSLARADQSQFQGIRKCNLKRLNTLRLLDGVRIVYSAVQKQGTIKIVEQGK